MDIGESSNTKLEADMRCPTCTRAELVKAGFVDREDYHKQKYRCLNCGRSTVNPVRGNITLPSSGRRILSVVAKETMPYPIEPTYYRFIRVPQAAKALGVHPRTIRRYIAEGSLPAVRYSEKGRWRIRIGHLNRFLKKGRNRILKDAMPAQNTPSQVR